MSKGVVKKLHSMKLKEAAKKVEDSIEKTLLPTVIFSVKTEAASVLRTPLRGLNRESCRTL